MKNWDGHCQKCGKSTNAHIMSMFDDRLICLDCEERERQNPHYQEAREADEAAIKSGNFNFPGIGWR